MNRAKLQQACHSKSVDSDGHHYTNKICSHALRREEYHVHEHNRQQCRNQSKRSWQTRQACFHARASLLDEIFTAAETQRSGEA